MTSQRFTRGVCDEFPRGSDAGQFSQTRFNTKLFHQMSKEVNVLQNIPTFSLNKYRYLFCPGIVLGPGVSSITRQSLCLHQAYISVGGGEGRIGNKPVNKHIL